MRRFFMLFALVFAVTACNSGDADPAVIDTAVVSLSVDQQPVAFDASAKRNTDKEPLRAALQEDLDQFLDKDKTSMSLAKSRDQSPTCYLHGRMERLTMLRFEYRALEREPIFFKLIEIGQSVAGEFVGMANQQAKSGNLPDCDGSIELVENVLAAADEYQIEVDPKAFRKARLAQARNHLVVFKDTAERNPEDKFASQVLLCEVRGLDSWNFTLAELGIPESLWARVSKVESDCG